MSKILVIYPNYDTVVTGGHIYDHCFIDRVCSSEQHSVNFMTEHVSFLEGSVFRKFKSIRKYDIILTNSRLYTRLIFLWLSLRLFSKCRLICIHHHFNFMSYEDTGSRVIHFLLEKLFLFLSTEVVIPSPYVRDVFTKMFPKKKIHYAELGVQKSFTEYHTHHSEEKQLSNKILFTGTVCRRKGVHFLVEVLNIINRKGIDFSCTIIGREENEKYGTFIHKQIQKYNLDNKIIFTEYVSIQKLAEYYNTADIFAFPSLLEGYGMVLIEAMSFGLPVVAFNNSAIPYTVKDGINGLLAKNKDASDFADKIELLLTNTTVYTKLSQGAFETSAQKRKMDDMLPDIDRFCKKI